MGDGWVWGSDSDMYITGSDEGVVEHPAHGNLVCCPQEPCPLTSKWCCYTWVGRQMYPGPSCPTWMLVTHLLVQSVQMMSVSKGAAEVVMMGRLAMKWDLLIIGSDG